VGLVRLRRGRAPPGRGLFGRRRGGADTGSTAAVDPPDPGPDDADVDDGADDATFVGAGPAATADEPADDAALWAPAADEPADDAPAAEVADAGAPDEDEDDAEPAADAAAEDDEAAEGASPWASPAGAPTP
jgi:hypothetical protein